MKTTVLALVLACVAMASAQTAAAQAQPAAPGGAAAGGQSGAPEIKDPAEYNAYVSCIQQQDASAKITCLEAFLTQYPNSVMKTTGLELLMNTYLQAGQQPKVLDTAKRLLTADSCNLRALALLTYLARQNVAAGQGMPQSLTDLTQYSSKGLECSGSAPKPASMSADDWEKLKKQTSLIFNGGAGFAALQNKNFPDAQKDLAAAVDQEPNDLQNVYPLAMSYLTANPPESEKGLCYIARAANLAQGAAQAQIQSYGQKVYKNYHGSEDGWNAVLFATKSAPFQCPSITKYVPPTPAQQAHDIVTGKTSDQIQQLSFGEWELVLSAGSPEDQDKVWSVIKNRPLQMEGTVISAQDVGDGAEKTTQLQIAGSEDDIEKKQPDITLTMTGTIPARSMPKAGDTLDFEGTPTDYNSPVHAATTPAQGAAGNPAPPAGATPAAGSTDTTAQGAAPAQAAPAAGAAPAPAGAPQGIFMMTMEKGKLLTKAGAPKKPSPTHRRTTTRKPQQ